MSEPYTGPNATAIEAWDTKMFDKWLEYRDVVATGLRVHGDAALRAVPPPRGGQALDLGCGLGDLTLDVARRVGEEGEAVGVDASRRFVARATEEAAQAGIPNARFFRADVQTDPLRGPWDVVYSRFGTMFFADPIAAFKNVRSVLASSGKLCMVVWRKREDNAYFQLALDVVDRLLPVADPPPATTGPFSMVDPDRVSDILVRAGFSRVAFERHDAPYVIGKDLDEAVSVTMNLGPGGERFRVTGEEGARRRDDVAVAMRKAFAPYVTDGGVRTPSSTWIVTAVA